MIDKTKYIEIDNSKNEIVLNNSLDDISPLSISPQMISYRIHYFENDNNNDIDFFDKFKEYNLKIQQYLLEIENNIKIIDETLIKNLSYLFSKLISINDCIEKKDLNKICRTTILSKIDRIDKIGETNFIKLLSNVSKLIKKKIVLIKNNIHINNSDINNLLYVKKKKMFFSIVNKLLKLINVEILNKDNIDIIINYYLDDINIKNCDDKEIICYLFKKQIQDNISSIID